MKIYTTFKYIEEKSHYGNICSMILSYHRDKALVSVYGMNIVGCGLIKPIRKLNCTEMRIGLHYYHSKTMLFVTVLM